MNIIIVGAIFATVLCRLNSTSSECQVYLNKLDNIIFDDWIDYHKASSQIIVTFGYYDPLYSNETHFGLTQEDGKPIDQTCLELQFFVYTSTQTDIMLLQDKTLTNSNTTNWRFLSFKIYEWELQQHIAPNEYAYTVYYSVIYTIYDTNTVQHIQQFDFTILLSSPNNSIYSKPYENFIYWFIEINIDVATEIKWCTDETCTVNTVPDLYINDQFYIQQTIVQSDLYYLTDTTVFYRGNGFSISPSTVQINNTVKGKTLIYLPADTESNNITIEVESYITLKQDGKNRLLMYNNFSEINH